MQNYMEILKKLVSFPTVNNPIEDKFPTRAILDYINKELLEPCGYTTHFLNEGKYCSLISYIRREDPKILFLGHCDVVPEGPVSGPWTAGCLGFGGAGAG